VLGFKLGPWPPPAWLSPWALAAEFVAFVALATVFVKWIVTRRSAPTASS